MEVTTRDYGFNVIRMEQEGQWDICNSELHCWRDAGMFKSGWGHTWPDSVWTAVATVMFCKKTPENKHTHRAMDVIAAS